MQLSFSGAYIPQIIKMIRYRSSKDVSLIMLIINAIGYCCGLGYVLIQGVDAMWLTLNYSLGFVMTFLCIFVWFIYKKSEKRCI